jgi:hypothetical protein
MTDTYDPEVLTTLWVHLPDSTPRELSNAAEAVEIIIRRREEAARDGKGTTLLELRVDPSWRIPNRG